MTERAERLIDRSRRLKDQRSTWEAHWEDLAELLRPVRVGFTSDRTPGEKRTEKIHDGTPLQAVRGLAAALDGMLKPKHEEWWNIRPEDDDLQDNDEVRSWLELVEERMRGAMYAPRARFLQATAEVDLDLVVFGTGCLFHDIVPRSLRFKAVPLHQVCVAENEAGQIDTVYRHIRWTARQAAQRFGADKLSENLRKVLRDDRSHDRDKRYEFIHVVSPREDYDGRRRDRLNMAFLSLYVEAEEKHEVEEGGYEELPYAVPRWETAADEVYGRSPGMLALPDASTLNEMGRTNLTAAHYAIEPPLLVPNDGTFNAAHLYPGGQTAYDVQMAKLLGKIPVQPLTTGANVPLALEMEDRRREMVWNAFFRNVLQLPMGGPQMTATEIIERKQEFIRTIGPTFGRLESDYTAPIVERVFAMMLRRGLFPPPPEVLQGRNIRFEYQSPVHRARRMIENMGLEESVRQLEYLADRRPEMLDHWDTDAIARDVPEHNGVPQKWLRPLDGVRKLRELRAQAEAEQQTTMQMGAAADGAPKVSRALRDVAEMETA